MTLENISEKDAVHCKTNLTSCCVGHNLSNWFFPNGTRVATNSKWWDFYRNRDEMVVLMHRRRGGEDGIYRCEIPDSRNVLQTIYIGVYNTTTGE